MKLLLLSLLLFTLAICDHHEFNPEIIKQIQEATKDMKRAVDYTGCIGKIRHQIGPSCHTSADSAQLESALCLGGYTKNQQPVELSLTDFWSCKSKYGLQKVNVVQTWNKVGAFTVEQDQPWSNELASACEDAWNKGLGAHQKAKDKFCDCRRNITTLNPKGFLNPKNCYLQPGFLDKTKMNVHCRMPYSDENNDNSWKNEIILAKMIEHYGPVSVMSSVWSFGTGSPQHPATACVPLGHGSGHNYVVAGYNLTDSPHTAYWILSDSVRKGDKIGYGFGRMFNHCSKGYHAGTWGIAATVRASRYCIENDIRGRCGGSVTCQVPINSTHIIKQAIEVFDEN